MSMPNEHLLVGAAVLLLISVLLSKISDRFGVPALLLFLLLGMVAGSDGPGGIHFDDPALAKFIGVNALVLILFYGGLSTEWRQVRPVAGEGLLLATFGVLLTALVVGLASSHFLGISIAEGLLLGSIVSSTDAAAVFSILRSSGISLKGRLKPLLELESGSNDPMAIFLTVGMIEIVKQPEMSFASLIVLFAQQMLIGAAMGYGIGKAMLLVVNRIKLDYEGLYPVLTLSLVFITFGLTDIIGGSGFLAVYIAGMALGNNDFIHKKSLLSFHDGVAWIMQITMFLALGLLVFPTQLVPVIGSGLFIAACLMLLARPLGVFISLLPGSLSLREKLFVSWVGLRGAAPIILATFPLLAGVRHADYFFNLIFFVVLTSVLFQGTSIALAAKWLKVDAPITVRRKYPIEYTPFSGLKSELRELIVPSGSPAEGKALVELGIPKGFLIILVARGDDFVLPDGGSALKSGDTLLVLSDRESYDEVRNRLGLSAK